MLKHALLALTAAVALACPAPAAAAEEDRNVAFILASMGLDAMPEGPATITSAGGARVVPAADAIREAAARAGSVELAALVASAAVPPLGEPSGAGDVWIFDVAPGACGGATWVPGGLYFAHHPQIWWYSGGIGAAEFAGGTGVIIDWTTKSFGGDYAGGNVRFAGQSDFYCVEFWGLRLWFPFIDGVAAWSAA